MCLPCAASAFARARFSSRFFLRSDSVPFLAGRGATVEDNIRSNVVVLQETHSVHRIIDVPKRGDVVSKGSRVTPKLEEETHTASSLTCSEASFMSVP